MNPSRIFGAIALVVGASLLLSEIVLGQDLVVELTGTPTTLLRVWSGIVFFFGMAALRLSVGNEKEVTLAERGVPQ
jgi:hypothetical protein